MFLCVQKEICLYSLLRGIHEIKFLERQVLNVPASVQFSCSVMSNSLWTHGLQHTRPPCPSPAPRVYPNSCPLSWWCHPTISCSVIPFSCLQSFPASGSFPMSQFFTSGDQSIGVSASISVPQMNTQDWSPLGWTGLLGWSPRDSQESSPTPQLNTMSQVKHFIFPIIYHNHTLTQWSSYAEKYIATKLVTK